MRVIAGLLVVVAVGACSDRRGQESGDAVARGREMFVANCAACHGDAGSGSPAGPPLVHEIYEPGHHSDASFQRAVAEGVTPHHWTFGPMPAQPGLDEQEVADITTYVRELQREAGIID